MLGGYKLKEDIGLIIKEMKDFILEAEMKKFKTNEEHKKYLDKIFNKISENEEYIKISRLRMKPIRYFYEEFVPLVDYVNIKYKKENDILWRWSGSETPEFGLMYDGIIKKGNNIVEKVEVTCPLHCREDFISGKSLNETGIYCYETVYVDDYENDCKQKLLDDVIKKNNKSTYDNSVTLLVVFDDYHFLPSNKLKDVQFIDSIFKELRKINYIFKNVYILMDKYDGSNLKYDSYLIQIK